LASTAGNAVAATQNADYHPDNNFDHGDTDSSNHNTAESLLIDC
jgi:hypothetical protein